MEMLTTEQMIEDGRKWAELIMQALPPEERVRLAGLRPEERVAGLRPEERVAGLALEERLVGLSQEDWAQLLKLAQKMQASDES